MNPMSLPKWILLTSILLAITVVAVIWLLTYHPSNVEEETVYNAQDAPNLRPGQKIKIMTWNVQYMAGKNYVFYYDVLDGSGPDVAPSKEDVVKTIKEVARVIKEESPDIIFLQEVDKGAKRTFNEDQLQTLLNLLPRDYKSYTSTYYWKNKFYPHPKIMGSTGMKLVTISKYKISEATRYQLSLAPENILKKPFNFKRAVLKAKLPVEGGKDFVALNTHLSAFTQGSDNMHRQVTEIGNILDSLEEKDYGWVIGGDFNLVPPGQYEFLSQNAKEYYDPHTELEYLLNKFSVIPSVSDSTSQEKNRWFTHFSNDPAYDSPDRTIDYLFFSGKMKLADNYRVRQEDTLHISDHFPIVSVFQIPD